MSVGPAFIEREFKRDLFLIVSGGGDDRFANPYFWGLLGLQVLVSGYGAKV